MIYANPGDTGSVVSFEKRYGNYIGGEFVAPVKGQYFDNISPVNGRVFCEIPRSTAEDIDKALANSLAALSGCSRSWLTAAKNFVLDRLAASASAFAASKRVFTCPSSSNAR